MFLSRGAGMRGGMEDHRGVMGGHMGMMGGGMGGGMEGHNK
jgi:hypothetical protein